MASPEKNLVFAGEYCHDDNHSTIGGAMQTGEEAAEHLVLYFKRLNMKGAVGNEKNDEEEGENF